MADLPAGDGDQPAQPPASGVVSQNNLIRSASASRLNGAGGRRFTTIDDHTWTYMRDNLHITTEIMGYGGIPIPSYKRIASMSPNSTISIRCITWNINEKPAKILETLCESLKRETEGRLEDILTISLQELPPSSMNFHEEAMQLLGPVSNEHVVFISNRTWSQMVLVLVRKIHIQYATEPSFKFVPAAVISKPIRTKGGIGVCFRFYQRWIVVVGCHLSHESVQQRIQDYARIKRNMSFPILQRFTNVDDMFAADVVILTGDLNFRLSKDLGIAWESNTNSLAEDVKRSMTVDELQVLRIREIAFDEFKEAPITFRPSYKFNIGTDTYTTRRIPSYTDRVLYHCKSNILTSISAYDTVGVATQSDHKPVFCIFNLNVTDKPIPQRYLT